MEIFKSNNELPRKSGFNVNGNDNATRPIAKNYSYKENKAAINGAEQESKYIETIELQNKKLNEIAWIQSHIIRTPIARILGLIDIIGDFKEKEDIAKVLEYISQSANELDGVIRDISTKSIPVMPGMIV